VNGVNDCRYGVARRSINPVEPLPLSCAGGDFVTPVAEIADDLHVKAFALRDAAGSTVLWVTYDLLFHDRGLNAALARHALERWQIPGAAVIVSHTHNHNAPVVSGYNPGMASPAYESLLVEAGRLVIDDALSDLRAGSVAIGGGDLSANVNRRLPTDEGIALRPNAAAPRDTELTTLQVRNAADELVALLVIWACHPVFYPRPAVVTSEFPGVTCDRLEAQLMQCHVQFVQGAAGDSRPVPTIDGDRFVPRDIAVMHGFAEQVAVAVLAQLDQAAVPLSLDLRPVDFVVDLPLVAQPRELFVDRMAAYPGRDQHPVRNGAAAVLRDYDGQPRALPLHCQLIRLADGVVVATMGGEPCSPVKEIVTQTLGERCIFVGYTDAAAYIVSDAMLAAGGYEPESYVEYALVGPFAPGVDDRIRDGFRTALAGLH